MSRAVELDEVRRAERVDDPRRDLGPDRVARWVGDAHPVVPGRVHLRRVPVRDERGLEGWFSAGGARGRDQDEGDRKHDEQSESSHGRMLRPSSAGPTSPALATAVAER